MCQGYNTSRSNFNGHNHNIEAVPIITKPPTCSKPLESNRNQQVPMKSDEVIEMEDRCNRDRRSKRSDDRLTESTQSSSRCNNTNQNGRPIRNEKTSSALDQSSNHDPNIYHQPIQSDRRYHNCYQSPDHIDLGGIRIKSNNACEKKNFVNSTNRLVIAADRVNTTNHYQVREIPEKWDFLVITTD